MPTRDTPWLNGTPNWVDLTTSDPAAAREFYAGLFGWQLDVGGPETGHYARATLDGRAVCGVNGMPADDHPPFWATYLATDNADAAAAAVESLGGTSAMPVMDVMDLGRMGVFSVPGGGFFGVWQAGTFFGMELFNEAGAMVWNEFLTRDTAAARDFYSAVFGYTYDDVPEGDGYMMIKVDGNPVGGIGPLPAGAPPHLPPHWGVYFSVTDCDASAQRAADLGGSVTSAPQTMPFGRHAVIADPQGAAFSVITPPAGM